MEGQDDRKVLCHRRHVFHNVKSKGSDRRLSWMNPSMQHGQANPTGTQDLLPACEKTYPRFIRSRCQMPPNLCCPFCKGALIVAWGHFSGIEGVIV